MMIAAIENDFEREFMTNLYEKFYPVMLSRAKSLLQNPEDAEEIVQDVFTDLIRRVEIVMSVDSKKLPAYLISAVKFTAYSHNKKKKHFNFVDFESEDVELLKAEGPLPEEIFIKNEVVFELKNALEKIPEKYKNVLEFKYILGLSDAEIGRKFGISESGVRSMIFRARRKAYSVMKEGK